MVAPLVGLGPGVPVGAHQADTLQKTREEDHLRWVGEDVWPRGGCCFPGVETLA